MAENSGNETPRKVRKKWETQTIFKPQPMKEEDDSSQEMEVEEPPSRTDGVIIKNAKYRELFGNT